MVRFVVLLKYTEVGVSQIHNTISRAAQFRDAAARVGVTMESLFWTLGEYDGIAVLSGKCVEDVIALTIHLAWKGYVRAQLLQAFSEGEIGTIMAKLPQMPLPVDDDD